MDIKLTQEKSEEQAEIIKMIAIPVIMLDTDYCKQVAKEMMKQVSFQQTLSVLNPNHSPTKDELLAKQSNALMYLVEYVEALKDVEKIKEKLKVEDETRAEISKLFL